MPRTVKSKKLKMLAPDHRLEFRFPDWKKREQPSVAEIAALVACANIILPRDTRSDAECHLEQVICGLYGMCDGAIVATIIRVDKKHTILEVRNN